MLVGMRLNVPLVAHDWKRKPKLRTVDCPWEAERNRKGSFSFQPAERMR